MPFTKISEVYVLLNTLQYVTVDQSLSDRRPILTRLYFPVDLA